MEGKVSVGKKRRFLGQISLELPSSSLSSSFLLLLLAAGLPVLALAATHPH